MSEPFVDRRSTTATEHHIEKLYDKVDSMGKTLVKIESRFDAHTTAEEITHKNNVAMMADVREDLKSLSSTLRSDREGWKKDLDHMQHHVEDKIGLCNIELRQNLKNQYYSKDQIDLMDREHLGEIAEERQLEIQAAIEGVQEEYWKRLKFTGWVLGGIGVLIGFLYKYGTIIISVMTSNKS